MLQRQKMVKFLQMIFLTFFFFLGACAHQAPRVENKPLATSHQKEWLPQGFVTHDNWLGMNIDTHPVNEVRTQIEQIGGVPLLSRGEAHITVLTPPEFEKIKEKMPMNKIEEVAMNMEIQRSKWKPICIGTFADPKSKGKIQNKTYYIVIESDSLIELRREIYRLYLAAGGEVSAFSPHQFYPHITIGYIEKDLHEVDGAIKNTQTCLFDLVTPQGEKLTHWNQ